MTVINIDDDETTSGSISSDGYYSYNVPEGIFYLQHNGRHWVHNMYQKLKTPLNSGTLKKENLSIPCCCSLDGKPRDAPVWEKFVKSSALDNLKKDINKIYPELIPAEPSIQQEVSKKQANEKGAASMSMVNFIKPSLNQHKVDINRWLYLNGIPFNVLTSSEFWAIHKRHYDNYTVLSQITSNDKHNKDVPAVSLLLPWPQIVPGQD